MSQSRTTEPGSGGPQKPAAPPLVPLTGRVLAGIAGLYVAAMLGGLNSRLGSLGLDDLRGVFGFAYDDASWLTGFYSAGELVIMPFVVWLITIFSMKRMAKFMLILAMGLAALLPFVQNLPLLAVLRFIQGMSGGFLIFTFMTSLFMFVPAHLRMYGFGFYLMTATFTPNVGLWLTALCTDVLLDWRLLYWQSLPLGALALSLVKFGLPELPANPGRLKNSNWLGLACIVPGAVLLALGMSQGVRLDWFNSPFVTWSIGSGLALCVMYGISDWHHPAPFLQLKVVVSHRNVWLALCVLIGMLTVALAGSMLPVTYLSRVWEYRPLQSASVGLIIALPQFFLSPAIAYLLYRRWLDARLLFGLALVVMAVACWLGAHLDREWIAGQFYLCQALIAVGQPLATISTVFMSSNNIEARLGPSFGGAINTARCLGVILGNALVMQFMQNRQAWHHESLRDSASLFNGALFPLPQTQLSQIAGTEAFTASVADAYTLLGVVALCLLAFVLAMRYTPPPRAPRSAVPGGSHA